MAEAAADFGDRLVVGDETTVGGNGARLTKALAPVLIGLTGPIFVFALLEPSALKHVKLMALAVLLPMMLAAVGLYVYSVLVPGEITAVVVDRGERALLLVESTALASRSTPVPFDDIVRLRFVTAYDDDGYASPRGEIETTSGDVIALPLLTSAAAVEALGAALADARAAA